MTHRTTMTNSAYSQQDVRAATLLEQSWKQKAELDRSIKSAFAHPASSSSNDSSSRSRNHSKESGSKLLDSELDFARKNLRNTYLNLLFTCTFTREAQQVDHLIWNDTSYNLITSYRSYISTAQKANVSDPQTPGRRGKASHDVARVKNEFRRFLNDEEIFWQELVGRLVRLFSLDEARANLESLGIACDSDGDTTIASSLPSDSFTSRSARQINEPDESLSQAALLPAKRVHLLETLHRFLIFCGDLARYRELLSHESEQHQQQGHVPKPGQSSRPSGAMASRSSAESPTYDFSRASAFYEQARLILPDKGNPSNQLAVISTYNADTFASLYHYYRALCVKTPFAKAKVNLEKLLSKPTSIYIDNQRSASLLWDAEKDTKARDPALVAELAGNVSAAADLIAVWTRQVIVLHGLFFQRAHLDHIAYLSKSIIATFSTLVRARALRADEIVRFLVTALCASWTTRLWRGAAITTTSRPSRPTSEGSDDRHRPRAIRSGGTSRRRATSPETARCVEYQVLAHVLGIFQELAQIDTEEISDAVQTNKDLKARSNHANGTANPVRNLTAVVRRTLPALRIMTKWTKTHLEYMQRIEKKAAESVQHWGMETMRRSGMEAEPTTEHAVDHGTVYLDSLELIHKCWDSYVGLINNLRYAFPFESLPNIGKLGSVGAPALCLEEDSDMRGFAPTRKATQSTIPGGTTVNLGMGEACANVESVRPSQVHPNEEQLMRIADLLIDAKVIAESDISPIQFDDRQNVFLYSRASTSPLPAAAPASNPIPAPAQGHVDQAGSAGMRMPADVQNDDSSEALSETMDDPVELAMRAVDGRGKDDSSDLQSVEQSMRNIRVAGDAAAEFGHDNDDEDRILIPSQVRSKILSRQDELSRQLFASYPHSSQGSTIPSAPSASASPATAQDLLLQMLSQRSSNIAATSASPSAYYHPGAASSEGGVSAANNLLLANGAPISSIWAPSAADGAVPAAGAQHNIRSNPAISGFPSSGSYSDPRQHQLQYQQPQLPQLRGNAGAANLWGDNRTPLSQPHDFHPNLHSGTHQGEASDPFNPYARHDSNQGFSQSGSVGMPFTLPAHLQHLVVGAGTNSGDQSHSPMTPSNGIPSGFSMGAQGSGFQFHANAPNSPFHDPYYPGATGSASPYQPQPQPHDHMYRPPQQ